MMSDALSAFPGCTRVSGKGSGHSFLPYVVPSVYTKRVMYLPSVRSSTTWRGRMCDDASCEFRYPCVALDTAILVAFVVPAASSTYSSLASLLLSNTLGIRSPHRSIC